MTINSRSKGKRGELELSSFIRAHGWEAHRGQQFKGGTDSPDVVTTLPGMFHIECKRAEAGNLYNWLAQAQADCGSLETPVVMHRKNGKNWVAIIELQHFLKLVRKAHGDEVTN